MYWIDTKYLTTQFVSPHWGKYIELEIVAIIESLFLSRKWISTKWDILVSMNGVKYEYLFMFLM